MKDEKDFVPFLTSPHQFLKRPDRARIKSKIIKPDQHHLQQHIQVMEWGEVDENAPEVEVIEKNGRVEGIRISCPNGGTVEVQFQYEESEKVLN